MTPKDILHAEFPEEAMAELHEAIDGLPHATHALWGLSYWLKERGDQMGAMMVQDWAVEFAEHEARRRRTRGAYASPRARSEPPRVVHSRSSLNLASCSLPEFASAVLIAAKHTRTGRWHDAVFISHVWRELEADGSSGITYDKFKRRLFEAYQAELLDLSRADLVEAMPHQDVHESELEHRGARFHFVRT